MILAANLLQSTRNKTQLDCSNPKSITAFKEIAGKKLKWVLRISLPWFRIEKLILFLGGQVAFSKIFQIHYFTNSILDI